MNPKESSEVTVETLLALRQEPEALRLITEKLRVKEMGPADHIRTKHEVKTFVEVGGAMLARQLVENATNRRGPRQAVTATETLQRGERLNN